MVRLGHHDQRTGHPVLVAKPQRMHSVRNSRTQEHRPPHSGQSYDAVLGDTQYEAFLKVPGSAYIDARDVTKAHTLALEKEAAGGVHILISAGSYIWQD
ncbi:hypothetical protein DXG01_011479 [Tephrocybe rancida]|nr:hypothetical protein DXG01_011479 [Tephrocybe rancida]